MKVCQSNVAISGEVWELPQVFSSAGARRDVYSFVVCFYSNYGETSSCKCWIEIRTYEKPKIYKGQQVNIFGALASRKLPDGRIRHFVFAEKIEYLETVEERREAIDAAILDLQKV